MKLAPKEGYRCVRGVQELTVKHENHQMCKNLEDPNPCLSVGWSVRNTFLSTAAVSLDQWSGPSQSVCETCDLSDI